MGRRQSLNFDGVDNYGYSLDSDGLGSAHNRGERRKGIFVSYPGIFLYILFTLMLACAVGLIVYYEHPDKGKCPCTASPASEETTTSTIDASTNLTPGQADPLTHRLPSTFKPIHYNIEIKPDIYTDSPANFTFSGNVSIQLTCVAQPCSIIYVNYKRLQIDNSSVTVIDGSSNSRPIGQIMIDQEKEFYQIQLQTEILLGETITVYMEFEGPLKRDMAGMYWSSYQENGTTRYMMATQFESADARKAFPCLDEPQLKATFQYSIWHRPPMTALSNNPNISSESRDNGWVVTHFDSTPAVLSTYLVAFAVADFTFIDSTITHDGFPSKYVRYFARPDFISAGYANYARDVSEPMFNYFENYFNETFTFNKTDQLAIPDFSAGAMENWGLITYRESRLLYDPRFTSSYDVWRFSKTIGHELLHQWLGNIVTCLWWDDLWLQEGAARFFENFALQVAQPTWDMKATYQSYTFYAALRNDQSGTGHPVYNPTIVNYDDWENMFSSITYDKGSAIYRMIWGIIFKNNTSLFDTAMRNYVQRHKFSNADHNDFFLVFDEAAVAGGLNLEVNVTEFGYTWIKQSGFPVVTAVRSGSQLVLTQHLFLINPDKPLEEYYPSPYNYMWEVPFSYVTDKVSTPSYVWLHKTNTNTTDANLQAASWIIGNHLQLGYYRVNYEESNWNAIKTQLWTDHTIIDIYSRGQLFDDAFTLARGNLTSQLHSLEMTEYLVNETEFLPWYAASQGFIYIDLMLSTLGEYSDFRTYMRTLVNPLYQSLGWSSPNTNNEYITNELHRELILRLSCKYGESNCTQTAVDLFQKWKLTPEDYTIIAPDLRDNVYCMGLKLSFVPDDDWDFVFTQYQQSDWETERIRYRDALACTRETWLLRRYFEMGATSDSRIYYSDYTSVMLAVARNFPVGHTIAYNYLDQNWSQMSGSKYSVLSTIASQLSTEFDLEQFQEFRVDHPPTSLAETNSYNDMEYAINANIKWRNNNEQLVLTWLQQAHY